MVIFLKILLFYDDRELCIYQLMIFDMSFKRDSNRDYENFLLELL